MFVTMFVRTIWLWKTGATNNTLQVHSWGCLVVQVMFHELMTSLMTSHDHKISQILQLIYLRQYLSYSVDQNFKMSEIPMAIFLVYSTSGITSGKKRMSRAQNGGHFENFPISNTASILPQIWIDRPKQCKKTQPICLYTYLMYPSYSRSNKLRWD